MHTSKKTAHLRYLKCFPDGFHRFLLVLGFGLDLDVHLKYPCRYNAIADTWEPSQGVGMRGLNDIEASEEIHTQAHTTNPRTGYGYR